MMEIRRISIQFAATIKRNRNSEEINLLNDIDIHERASQNNQSYNSEELSEKKIALEKLYNYQAQGAYVRTRAMYKVEGERPTKMFCALEKFNAVQKYVPQLIVEDEVGHEKTISKQMEVEQEIQRFYRDLYKNKDDKITIDSIHQFIDQNTIPDCMKLSECQKHHMEGKITVNEMTQYLKKLGIM